MRATEQLHCTAPLANPRKRTVGQMGYTYCICRTAYSSSFFVLVVRVIRNSHSDGEDAKSNGMDKPKRNAGGFSVKHINAKKVNGFVSLF